MTLFTHSAINAYALTLFKETVEAVATSAPDEDLTQYLDGLRAMMVSAFIRATCVPDEPAPLDDNIDPHLALLMWISLSDIPCPYSLQGMLEQARVTLTLQQQAPLERVVQACDRLHQCTTPLSPNDARIWQLFYQQLFNYNETIA